jgi:hypothetical protein
LNRMTLPPSMMKPMMIVKRILIVCAFLLMVDIGESAPLKVYILAGQSNMQGHARISTLDYMKDDADTAVIYRKMVDGEGKPVVCERTWIAYTTNYTDEVHGKLTAGFGAKPEKIGPEYSFGVYMESFIDNPILIIKTAWGGKSLNTDFRPPSAGPYPIRDGMLGNLKAKGKDIEAFKAEKEKATGHYYRQMMDFVKKVLADPKRVCPAYDVNDGYELAGFVWFQGFNDLVDGNYYPNKDQEGGYDEYSELLAHFIRDVRKDLDAPDLPFVIGVNGTGGPVAKMDDPEKHASTQYFRMAMAAPASLPEFMDTVTAVWTDQFHDPLLADASRKEFEVKKMERKLRMKNKYGPNKDGSMDAKAQQEYLENYKKELFTPEEEAALAGISNAQYHYLGAAKILAPIGKAFAEALHRQEN